VASGDLAVSLRMCSGLPVGLARVLSIFRFCESKLGPPIFVKSVASLIDTSV
jgi:hypothetical protein